MNVIEAIQQRKSVRAFLNKEVKESTINAILTAASHAPSGANIQPWQVAVVTGETKLKLQTQIESCFREGDKGKADYCYYPEQWIEPYKSRRIACGLQMYSTLKIVREDKQRQLDLWAANYRAFDAPVMLFIFYGLWHIFTIYYVSCGRKQKEQKQVLMFAKLSVDNESTDDCHTF